MLILWGIVIHVIFLVSIFDIYFKSPVIHGVKEFSPQGSFPASRIVLFSADGLRAESLFRSNNVPYLKYLITYKAKWGISHTRVPTESRPGHVAFIAGFYEDPSAVAKGWKENPVEFDSLFNRSRHTWSWGSPDILPMFAKGATGNHVETHYYSHEEEDFSGKISTSKLDIWVFEKVKDFLKKTKNDKALMDLLQKDKLIFFLHLLGLDTAGHTHKPHSQEYEDNLKVVDEGIKQIEALFEEFFEHDGKTTYVFTSDHGMTDWGSHGTGEHYETQTPLIVWGAGIPAPNPVSFGNKKNFMSNPLRKDVNQADICPLIAALSGIPIPVNSVGVLPEAYFESDIELKAKGFYSNARQLLSQYSRKMEIVEDHAIKQIYKPFSKLRKEKVDRTILEMTRLLNSKEFENVITVSEKTIHLSLEGLEYYQNYYQNFLLACTTFSFISWILWLLTILVERYNSNENSTKPQLKLSKKNDSINMVDIVIHCIFGTVLTITIVLIYVQNLPIQYNIYCCLPVILWWKRCLCWKLWGEFLLGEKSSAWINTKYVLIGCLYLFGSTLLVLIFFFRWMLSVCLFCVAITQLYSTCNRRVPIPLVLCWLATCLGMAVISFLPVVGNNENLILVGISGLVWFFSSLSYLMAFPMKLFKGGFESRRQSLILVLPVLGMIIGIQNKYFVEYSFHAKQGLPWYNQAVSWIVTASLVIVPLYSSFYIVSRLYCIMGGFAVIFILLSVSHEGFFLFLLACNLMCWIGLEHYGVDQESKFLISSFRPPQKKAGTIDAIPRHLKLNDFRRSFFFLFYIILSFFGTGNIASLNSFDPQWVRCFVSQFSPFLMGGLILFKTMIPFLYVACAFCAVNVVVKAPTGQLFLIVLVFSDLMGLHFLHMVTNKGSWLDIGTSISHYVIMETIVLFISILYCLGELLTGISEFNWMTGFGPIKKKSSD